MAVHKPKAAVRAIAEDRQQMANKVWIATLVSGVAVAALTLLALLA